MVHIHRSKEKPYHALLSTVSQNSWHSYEPQADAPDDDNGAPRFEFVPLSEYRSMPIHFFKLAHDLHAETGELIMKAGWNVPWSVILKYGKAIYILDSGRSILFDKIMMEYGPGSIIIFTGEDVDLEEMTDAYDASFHLDTDGYYQEMFNTRGMPVKIMKTFQGKPPLVVRI